VELDELEPGEEGQFTFVFERNRPTLRLATTLTERGSKLASEGCHADALERFQEAMEVDPFDPDPPYQAGMCLMEMGCYGEARGYFEETERLAPGWYHCRTDRWLAEQLERSELRPEAFQLVRYLEAGDLPPKEVVRLCKGVRESLGHFAPLWLAYGNALVELERCEEAAAALRKGLECAAEPDVESRLLAQLAGIVPDGPERDELLSRAVSLNGNLVAVAAAWLIRGEKV
jgi:tetratricopeptide (TPR) repeat protein